MNKLNPTLEFERSSWPDATDSLFHGHGDQEWRAMGHTGYEVKAPDLEIGPGIVPRGLIESQMAGMTLSIQIQAGPGHHCAVQGVVVELTWHWLGNAVAHMYCITNREFFFLSAGIVENKRANLSAFVLPPARSHETVDLAKGQIDRDIGDRFRERDIDQFGPVQRNDPANVEFYAGKMRAT